MDNAILHIRLPEVQSLCGSLNLSLRQWKVFKDIKGRLQPCLSAHEISSFSNQVNRPPPQREGTNSQIMNHKQLAPAPRGQVLRDMRNRATTMNLISVGLLKTRNPNDRAIL